MTTTGSGTPGSPTNRFESVQSAHDAMREVNYLADEGIAVPLATTTLLRSRHSSDRTLVLVSWLTGQTITPGV